MEKERFKHDREKSKRSRMKTTIDDEIEEDTRVTDGDEEFLLFYFRRERQVLGNMFGHKYVFLKVFSRLRSYLSTIPTYNSRFYSHLNSHF